VSRSACVPARRWLGSNTAPLAQLWPLGPCPVAAAFSQQGCPHVGQWTLRRLLLAGDIQRNGGSVSSQCPCHRVGCRPKPSPVPPSLLLDVRGKDLTCCSDLLTRQLIREPLSGALTGLQRLRSRSALACEPRVVYRIKPLPSGAPFLGLSGSPACLSQDRLSAWMEWLRP